MHPLNYIFKYKKILYASSQHAIACLHRPATFLVEGARVAYT